MKKNYTYGNSGDIEGMTGARKWRLTVTMAESENAIQKQPPDDDDDSTVGGTDTDDHANREFAIKGRWWSEKE